MSERIGRTTRLARLIGIEGSMAQQRTKRTTAHRAVSSTPEQLHAAREWLDEWLHTTSPGELLPQLSVEDPHRPLTAIVEALSSMATPAAATLLGQIAATTDAKELQKAARRALYRLKTRGVDTDRALPQEPRKSVLEVPKLPLVASLASQIDFDGTRALYLARRRPFSGLVLVSLIINDQDGIVNCHALPLTKKELTRLLADIRSDERLTHADLPPSYAQQLVDEGYQRNLSTGKPAPADFQGMRDLIGAPDSRWEQPPIYHVLNAEEVRGQLSLLALSAELLSLKELQGWHLPPDLVHKYREDVRRTADSPIIVSQVLQQERIDALQKDTMRGIFDAEQRARYRARLEETAYLLWQTKRPEEAKRAFAAALALQAEGVDPAEHPFVKALFKRSAEMAEAMEQQEAGRVTVAAPRLWTP
jgi:hypothetical protein